MQDDGIGGGANVAVAPGPDTGYEKRPGMLVAVSGLITSAIALAIVGLLAWYTTVDLMGLYLLFIVPVGAIAVGSAAGSGYGLASWLTGAKIGGMLLVFVVVFQLLTYGMAQYLEYRAAVAEAGYEFTFFEYYDAVTRSISFSREEDPAAEGMGVWGYAFRGLEVLGFAFGGLLVPLFLMDVPYCDRCQVYMKTRPLGNLPAGVDPKALKKEAKGAGEQADVQGAAGAELERAQEQVQQLMGGAAEGDVDTVRTCLAERGVGDKEAAKLNGHVAIKLASCPRCERGLMRFNLNMGQGKKTERTHIGDVEVDDRFVRGVRG